MKYKNIDIRLHGNFSQQMTSPLSEADSIEQALKTVINITKQQFEISKSDGLIKEEELVITHATLQCDIHEIS